MTSNVNPETGIAYGYIAANALEGEVVDELLYGSGAVNEDANSAFEEFKQTWKHENANADGTPNEEDPDDSDCQEFWDRYEDYEPRASPASTRASTIVPAG